MVDGLSAIFLAELRLPRLTFHCRLFNGTRCAFFSWLIYARLLLWFQSRIFCVYQLDFIQWSFAQFFSPLFSSFHRWKSDVLRSRELSSFFCVVDGLFFALPNTSFLLVLISSSCRSRFEPSLLPHQRQRAFFPLYSNFIIIFFGRARNYSTLASSWCGWRVVCSSSL